jgi:hypothetical protein
MLRWIQAKAGTSRDEQDSEGEPGEAGAREQQDRPEAPGATDGGAPRSAQPRASMLAQVVSLTVIPPGPHANSGYGASPARLLTGTRAIPPESAMVGWRARVQAANQDVFKWPPSVRTKFSDLDGNGEPDRVRSRPSSTTSACAADDRLNRPYAAGVRRVPFVVLVDRPTNTVMTRSQVQSGSDQPARAAEESSRVVDRRSCVITRRPPEPRQDARSSPPCRRVLRRAPARPSGGR